jgi:hypothetical protein
MSASGYQFLRLLRGRIRLQADVIVNRIVKTLLAPEVSLLWCAKIPYEIEFAIATN